EVGQVQRNDEHNQNNSTLHDEERRPNLAHNAFLKRLNLNRPLLLGRIVSRIVMSYFDRDSGQPRLRLLKSDALLQTSQSVWKGSCASSGLRIRLGHESRGQKDVDVMRGRSARVVKVARKNANEGVWIVVEVNCLPDDVGVGGEVATPQA